LNVTKNEGRAAVEVRVNIGCGATPTAVLIGGETGHMIAVEPSPANAGLLPPHLVTVVEAAVGETESAIEFTFWTASG
jgi:hypothetical protein